MHPDLFLDIETYSTRDLAECGRHRYAEDVEVLMLAYAWGDATSDTFSPVQVIDLTRGMSLEECAPDVYSALLSPDVRKHAHNAAFERACLSAYIGKPMPAEQWHCTMVDAARHGLPLSLERCGQALRIPADQAKMRAGKALIQKFCKPYRGKRVDHTEVGTKLHWDLFLEYCKRDVEAEIEIFRRLRMLDDGKPNLPRWERDVEICDAEINDRGIALDAVMAKNASSIDDDHRAALMTELRELTGMDNPNSLPQMKKWIAAHTGVYIKSLAKADLAQHMRTFEHYPRVLEALRLRSELGKTSTAKYKAMLACVCKDGRMRGLTQYYGARTGRWAGRLVQLQNLPQNHLSDLDTARCLVKSGDGGTLEFLYGSVTRTLSELIRTAFVAEEGKELLVCDYSAIEARVLAWLAGEQWVLDVFAEGGDIYCATASQMFGVPVAKKGPNADLRQKGKVAVLALGYQGGVGALEQMGGARMGLDLGEMHDIVQMWRGANPHICKFWRAVEASAFRTVREGKESRLLCGLTFRMEGSGDHRAMTIELPSRRKIWYYGMRIGLDGAGRSIGDGKEVLEFEGVNQVTRQWGRTTTYGGKLTENIVQAVARDLLANALVQCSKEGLDVVMHVHDEIVVEAPKGTPLERLTALFDKGPEWAKGLPLKGAGYRTPYYIKD